MKILPILTILISIYSGFSILWQQPIVDIKERLGYYSDEVAHKRRIEVQEFGFKLIPICALMFTILIALWNYQNTNNQFGLANRPLPKVTLDENREKDFIEIALSNKGKNSIVDAKIFYRFISLEGDKEKQVKTYKACVKLVEQEDSIKTRIKFSDLDFKSGNLFFIAAIQSESLYKDKTSQWEFYKDISEGEWHPLNGNYGALGGSHRETFKKHKKELEEKIQEQSFDGFCIS